MQLARGQWTYANITAGGCSFRLAPLQRPKPFLNENEEKKIYIKKNKTKKTETILIFGSVRVFFLRRWSS